MSEPHDPPPSAMNHYGEEIGLTGGFVILRNVWNGTEYVTVQQSRDGHTWEPYDDSANVASIRYIGGPKNGKVEW